MGTSLSWRQQQFAIFSCGCLCLIYVGVKTTILTTMPTAITLFAIVQETQKALENQGLGGMRLFHVLSDFSAVRKFESLHPRVKPDAYASGFSVVSMC